MTEVVFIVDNDQSLIHEPNQYS